MPSSLNYDDVRTSTVYAETQTISTSDEAGTGLGATGPAGEPLPRPGPSRATHYGTRDVSGTADITRPHPLYLNRPRTASAELSGYGYTEGAFDVDVAYPQRPVPGTSTGRLRGRHLLQSGSRPPGRAYVRREISVRPADGPLDAWAPDSRERHGLERGRTARLPLRKSKPSGSASSSATAPRAWSWGRRTPTKSTIDAGGLSVGVGLRAYF
jgi:hypothetical protein